MVSTYAKFVDQRVRFCIVGYYTNTDIGRNWYANVGAQIESRVKVLCGIWTAQGHPISLNDFEIQIEVFH
jgi:hypothetical protein